MGLFNLKLSRSLDASMIFKIRIDPYFTFKKDGEKISYEDNFFFESVKLQSIITHKKAPELSYFNT
jgi:hypothetical protein